MAKTILHADDSPAVRHLVAEQLTGLADVNVVSVPDGVAALRVLQESSCDLLITDLEMPEIDGLSLVSVVREMPMHRFLPILVLSTRRLCDVEPERCRGVTGWIVKPADSEHLKRWIRRSLPG